MTTDHRLTGRLDTNGGTPQAWDVTLIDREGSRFILRRNDGYEFVFNRVTRRVTRRDTRRVVLTGATLQETYRPMSGSVLGR